MEKFKYLVLLSFLCALEVSAARFPSIYAHRGCWLGTEVPENSIAAVEMAKRYGYKVVECDVHYTKDSVMVLMHDNNDMRRCIRRKQDNAKLDIPLKLSEVTYEELKRDYVLTSDNPLMRTPVPTFEAFLLACKRNGIMPLLHTDVTEAFHLAKKMFGNKWIAFSANYRSMLEARRISNCPILLSLDGVTSREAIEKMKTIGGKIGLSSMNYKMMDQAFIHDIRGAGYVVQASIFPKDEEMRAIHDGVTIVLSNWCYMPDMKGRHESQVKRKNIQLPSGKLFSHKWEAAKYGATTLEITFKGEMELILNGESHYVRKHEKMDSQTIGARFMNGVSSIEIIAHDDLDIKTLKAKSYTF